ncbi:MAG: penicillin-binding protein 2 [Candidatus Pacebacteria bacterium]|nr:penicillin-binding protein 2 [Candidatus Paceibacterota bacterium]
MIYKFISLLKLNKKDTYTAQADPFVVKHGNIKDSQLKDPSYRSDWTEETFMGKSSVSEVVGKTFELKRLKFLIILLAVFVFFLIARVAYLQVVKGDYYHGLAEGNRVRIKDLEANRGIIYDRNFKPLVRNQANFVLYLVPADLPEDILERDEILRNLDQILSLEPKEEESPWFVIMKDSLAKVDLNSLEAFSPVFVSDNLSYETAMKLYLLAEKTPGLSLISKTRREYLFVSSDLQEEESLRLPEASLGISLSHVLGYTGKISPKELEAERKAYNPLDYVGKTGLESYWEKDLRGVKGKKHIEVDALGQEKKVINEYLPQQGSNLILSIDSDLQAEAERVLRKYLEKLNLDKGSIIILNPNSGEVLSLVSWPAYNNNIFARGVNTSEYKEFLANPNQPLFNRAISGEFPSGSTIKPVFSAAALEEGVISENTTFLSTGGLRISQWFFPDWRLSGHGLTNVRKAIAESVNTFFYYIGGGYADFSGLGLENMVKYAKLFGLGEKSGLDLYSEADGFVPTREWKEEVKNEPWYIGDTYHFAIGQGDLLATPLQVANFTAVFANNGKLLRPHLVKEIRSSSNEEVVVKINPEIIREKFIDDYNLLVVKQGMRQAVTSGSARFLSDLPFSSAGKTGTAQWSSNHANHAWFTGFAPYENPEIVVTILVEEGEEGSAVAVPIAKEIMRWYFENKE